MQLLKCRSRHVPLVNLASFLLFTSPALAGVISRDSTIDTSSSNFGLLSADTVALDAKWQAAYEKATNFVSQLSNDDKVLIITERDVASVNWTTLEKVDGSQGLRGYYQASGFSELSSLAQTWDRDMIYTQMKAVGDEVYGKGYQLMNAPTSQPLGRTPWGGRLVETISPDSYLNGITFGKAVSGLVNAGLIVGGKHFLLNEQETNRATSTNTLAYSSNADDKTTHETYLFPFYDGVKSGLGAVMCAMNRVNDTQSCENSNLLMNLLKTELGFPGFVYPDQGAQTSTFGSANGGEDYGSTQYWSSTKLLAGLDDGNLTQARLDDMAIRNVISYYYAGLDNGEQPSLVSEVTYGRDVRGNHSQIIRANGAAAISLLKNTNNALPLKAPRSIGVFGANARAAIGGPSAAFGVSGTPSTYNGHLTGGSGSGDTTFSYLITPEYALNERAAIDGTNLLWLTNDTYDGTIDPKASLRPGTNRGISYSSYATNVDVCMVFINAYSGEGADRSELRNDDQDTMIETVAENCNNTMVIVNTVGVRILDRWIDHDNVTAVLYAGLLGQESGHSLIDVIYGYVNPSGRLSYTIAKNESDYPVVGVCEETDCDFTEGNYIDYKHFDKYNITPRYEFGFGLSYTTFEYSDISALQTSTLNSTYATGPRGVGGREDLWDNIANVTATISNAGSVAGNEIAQLYVTFPEAADAPVTQLRGFEKVFLESGASATVTFPLRRRDLSYWDVSAQEWAVAAGTYTFNVGASSRDFRGSSELELVLN